MMKRKESPRDDYYAGKISAEEFLDRLFNSREADRKRQRTEKKFGEIISKYKRTNDKSGNY